MRNFDSFTKPLAEFRVKTVIGGYLSVSSVVLIIILFFSELSYFLKVEIKDHMELDKFLESGKVPIHLSLEFERMPCSSMGFLVLDNKKDLVIPGYKYQASVTAEPYVPPGAKNPGCRWSADMEFSKVPFKLLWGNKAWLSKVDNRGAVEPPLLSSSELQELKDGMYNFSHNVQELRYGPMFPGMQRPLVGRKKTSDFAAAQFQYDVHCIPTEYNFLNSSKIKTFQYSVTEYAKPSEIVEYEPDEEEAPTDENGNPSEAAAPKSPKSPSSGPPSSSSSEEGEDPPGTGRFAEESRGPGVQMTIDFAPFSIRKIEWRASFIEFITRCCALLGGIFAFSGMVDRLCYKGTVAVGRKVSKLSSLPGVSRSS